MPQQKVSEMNFSLTNKILRLRSFHFVSNFSNRRICLHVSDMCNFMVSIQMDAFMGAALLSHSNPVFYLVDYYCMFVSLLHIFVFYV